MYHCGKAPRPARGPDDEHRSRSATSCATPCATGPITSSSAKCGGGEAADLLQALNTGQGGSLTTVHANNADSALSCLASCANAGRRRAPVGRDLPGRGGRHRPGDPHDAPRRGGDSWKKPPWCTATTPGPLHGTATDSTTGRSKAESHAPAHPRRPRRAANRRAGGGWRRPREATLVGATIETVLRFDDGSEPRRPGCTNPASTDSKPLSV